MIISAIAASSKAFEASLAAKARTMGEALAQRRKLARQGPGEHWRSALLLWPLFTQER